MKRAIQQQLENPLAQAILSGHFIAGDVIKVAVGNGELLFSK
jgi:ATP-dependent Clp protease ATP-binding subunit ClpB